MSDQLSSVVERMVAAGESEADIALVIQQYDHQDHTAKPIATGGGRGTGLDVRTSDQWAHANAPVIGGSIAALATGGGSIPVSMLAAGAGGTAGAGMRGDSAESALWEGGKQALTEAVGIPLRLLGKVAKPVYRAAIPKIIQDKFSQAALAESGLASRTLLGTKSGTRTAQAAAKEAGEGIQAAAGSVPSMSGRDIQQAFGPKYNKALTGGKIDRANEINAHVRQSMNEIGENFTGKQQLARKEFLEPESKAAMGAANPNMVAVNPQLANIERKAITKNLHLSPTMDKALTTSQAAIGVERAAKATENSSVLNRLSHGGVWNAAKSPAGLSGAAITMDQLSNVPFAQLIRAAQLAQLGQDQ